MATDLFLEMAELPATGSLGTGQLDTRDLLVAGVPISISSKYLYLYLYLELSGSTNIYAQNNDICDMLINLYNDTIQTVYMSFMVILVHESTNVNNL